MDEKNCSNLHICQAVDNQSNKCLTEKLAQLYPSSDILNQSTINHNQIQSKINTNNQLSESFTKEEDNKDDKFIAEIELISLIGQRESLPRYRLRVDPCTAFIGYKNKDFKSAGKRVTRYLSSKHSTLPKSITELTTVNSELSDNLNINNNNNKIVEYHSEEDFSEEAEDEEEDDESLGLTEEQIENTLDYFILCGLRVSQMTKTYEDLDAITQLLEEKQTDLELAAKIGKNLLERNRDLQSRLIETEKNLCARDEVISQLNHNLSVKDSLLRIFLRDSDQLADGNDDQISTTSSGRVSPIRSQGLSSSTGGDGLSLSSVNFSQLNRKLQDLEEENNILRQERNRLSETADQLDEHETALVRDCARQLIAANMHIRTLSDELAKKSDAYINQQSEVTRLLTRGLDLESRVKQLTAENEMLINRLKEAQISQTLLTSELKTSRDKYDECLTLYNEARSEIRALRKRSRRSYFRPGSLMSNTSIMNSPTSWHHTPSLSSNYLSGIAITPTQSDPDPTSCYNPSSSHQNVSDDDDGSSSSLDMLATQQHPGSDNLETTLAADLAHTKMKEYAADNVKHLFRAMEQVRSTRTPSSQPTSSIDNNNHNIMLPESGQEDTVSSSGFVSGSEPSENPLKHRSGGSEQVSDSGSPYAGRLLANQNISPIHLQDVERRPGSGGYQQQQHHHYYQTRSNHEHLLESEKRHSWLGCCDISSNVSEKGYLSGHDYNIKYKNSFDDSLLSCDPDVVGTNQLYYKLPQRLKLIKPLDGSNVLQHWQNLATPSFTRALFDAPLPGVQSRAGVPNTASNSASNTKITDDNIDDKRRTMSFQPLPLNSISSKYDDGLTTYSTFNSPQTQTNVKFPCDSLERRHKISQFGSNSSTCLLNNRIRARSLDHLIMGSPSGTTTGGGGGSSYCKDKINESVQFSRAFNHIRLDDSSMTMSPTAPFRTPFSLTSLVSAILPFSVSPQSDDKSSSVSKPSVTSSSNITESMRLRPKCPLATTTTGLQGLLDMHKEEDSDTSKTLLHRTSSSTTSKSIPANQTTSSSSSSIPICSNTPNPQPPTLICPNIVNRPTQYTRSSRGTNLTEITEESSSPPKSQESLSQQQQQQETQQIHETTLGSQE